MYTEEVNKIALSSNDNKIIQKFDKVTTYQYGTNAFMVSRNEMLFKNKVMCDQVKDRLETDDYLSALIDRSKNLRRNISIYNDKLKSIYNDKLKSINSKLSMVIHTSDFIENIYIYIFFSIKMGKTEFENLDLKNKLNIVLGIIANAKKDLQSLKTEINDVKNDHAMFKKDLNSLNNEFSESLKESLKVSDNLIKIDNGILMTKKF